jgi:hypothetical protein
LHHHTLRRKFVQWFDICIIFHNQYLKMLMDNTNWNFLFKWTNSYNFSNCYANYKSYQKKFKHKKK